jgi:drug/metabolite transporter (DMT)-like permease
MRSPLATILPLCSAIAYTFAALVLKRATEGGVGPWRVAFVVNWITALVFAPWWFTGRLPFTWASLGHAILAGCAFFTGQVFTFLALSRGDVSLTTPVLGTKVIFVALFGVAFAGEKLGPGMWLATLLTVIATALLGGQFGVHAERLRPTFFFGFGAAVCFAGTDVMQQRWVPAWGFGHFAPTMFLTIALLSFSLLPVFHAPLSALPRVTWGWVIAGAVTLALQATGVAYSIATFREVTTTNIIYNTRGIWSVILVWVVGHWFGNTERSLGKRIMQRRLIGALLLLAAVFLCLQRL